MVSAVKHTRSNEMGLFRQSGVPFFSGPFTVNYHTRTTPLLSLGHWGFGLAVHWPARLERVECFFVFCFRPALPKTRALVRRQYCSVWLILVGMGQVGLIWFPFRERFRPKLFNERTCIAPAREAARVSPRPRPSPRSPRSPRSRSPRQAAGLSNRQGVIPQLGSPSKM